MFLKMQKNCSFFLILILKIQNVFFDVMNFSQNKYSKICENYKNGPIVTRFEPVAQGNVLSYT